MGRRFARWLARPSTIHFLRQVLAADGIAATTRTPGVRLDCRHQCRRRASTAAHTADVEEHHDPRLTTTTTTSATTATVRTCRRVSPPPRPTSHVTAESLLGSSVQEYGMRMSMASGVHLLSPDLANQSSLGELRFQADVDNELRDGKLLIDQPEHRENWMLWLEILRLRQRLDGRAGGLAVWRAMRRKGLVLPSEGDAADALWKAIGECGVGVDDEAIVVRQDMIAYAKEMRVTHSRLYPQMCNGIFALLARTDTRAAGRWFEQCLTNGIIDASTAVKTLLPAVLAIPSTQASSAFRLFKSMYKKNSMERSLYDVIIPQVIAQYGPGPASRWHKLLLGHGDAPSSELYHRADVQQLFDERADHGLPMVHARPTMSAPPPTLPANQIPPLSRFTMSSLLGEVHGIKPKVLSDSFVANMFATRAFSLELVLRGLSFLGIDHIGPLALREFALRSRSPVEFGKRLNALRKANIRVDECIYSKLLGRVVADGSAELYKELLDSDQHPEAYEDVATQEALLASFLRSGHHAQVRLTTLALTLHGTQVEANALNYLAQHFLSRNSWKLARHNLQLLQFQHMPIRKTTIMSMVDHLLPKRRQGKAPTQQRQSKTTFDSLRFVTNIMKYAAEQALEERHSRLFPYPWLWVELLKRHGMTGRWLELETLIRWLVKHTARNQCRRVRVGGRKAVVTVIDHGPLKHVLTAQMFEAIFVWGFRKAMNRPPSTWQTPHTGSTRDQASHGEMHSPTPEFQQASHVFLSQSKDAAAEHGETQAPASHIQPAWHQGLRVLRQLKHAGVFVDTGLIRQAFITRMWILFGPGTSKEKINEAIRRYNRWPLGHFVRGAMDVWEDKDLFSDEVHAALDAGDEFALYSALFGRVQRVRIIHTYDRRYEWVDVSKWLEESKHRPAPYRPTKLSTRLWLWQRSPFRRDQHPETASPPHVSAEAHFPEPHWDEDTKNGEPPSVAATTDMLTPPVQHQQPSAHSSSSHPAPNLLNTPGLAPPGSHSPPPALQASHTQARHQSRCCPPAPAD